MATSMCQVRLAVSWVNPQTFFQVSGMDRCFTTTFLGEVIRQHSLKPLSLVQNPLSSFRLSLNSVCSISALSSFVPVTLVEIGTAITVGKKAQENAFVNVGLLQEPGFAGMIVCL